MIAPLTLGPTASNRPYRRFDSSLLVCFRQAVDKRVALWRYWRWQRRRGISILNGSNAAGMSINGVKNERREIKRSACCDLTTNETHMVEKESK
jgi:hypothetical protein